MTPFWTSGFAMRSRGAAFDPWFSNGNTDVNHYFGADSNEDLYLTGIPASGDITGTVASNVLSDVTNPLYQQALTGIAVDPLGCGFHQGTADSFDAANASVHDFDGVAWAMLVPFLYSGTGTTLRNLVSKRKPTSAYNGFELNISSAGIFVTLDDGPSAESTESLLGNLTGAIHYILFGVSVTNSVQFAYTDVHTPRTKAWSASITSPGIFSLGSSRLTAAAAVIGPMPIWSGAAAETIYSTQSTTLPAWATATGAF